MSSKFLVNNSGDAIIQLQSGSVPINVASITDQDLLPSYPVFTDGVRKLVSKKVAEDDCSFVPLVSPLTGNLDFGTNNITNIGSITAAGTLTIPSATNFTSTSGVQVRNLNLGTSAAGTIGTSSGDLTLSAAGSSILIPSDSLVVRSSVTLASNSITFSQSGASAFLQSSAATLGLIIAAGGTGELQLASGGNLLILTSVGQTINLNDSLQVNYGEGKLQNFAGTAGLVLESTGDMTLAPGTDKVINSSTNSTYGLTVDSSGISARNLVSLQSPILFANMAIGAELTQAVVDTVAANFTVSGLTSHISNVCSINTSTGVTTFSNSVAQKVRCSVSFGALASVSGFVTFGLSKNGAALSSATGTRALFLTSQFQQVHFECIVSVSSGDTLTLRFAPEMTANMTLSEISFTYTGLNVA